MRERLPLPVVVLALAMLAVRLALAAYLQLAFDEAYYWTWAHNPALSYFDHPPMVAWFIQIGLLVAGDSELGVRLLGPFAVFASTLLIAASVRDFGGGRRAMIIAGMFAELTLAAPILAVVMTPDTPLWFFAALTLRLLAAIAAGGPGWLWLAAGLAGGGALLSKYTGVMLGLGILIWLVAVPSRRRALATIWPWAGAATALAVFSPVIIWNARNDWASFFKQGGRTAEPFRPSLSTFADFLGSQTGLATPLIALAILIGLAILLREAARQRTDRAVLLTALAVPFLAYLTIYSIGGDVEGNWALVTLPAGIAAAALVLGDRWDTTGWRRLAKLAAGIGAFCSAVLVLYLAIPFDHSLGRRDITQRLSGHGDVAAEIVAIAEREGLDVVASDNYGTNALLDFYLPPSFETLQITERDRYRGWVVPARAAEALKGGEVMAVMRDDGDGAIWHLFDQLIQIGSVERKHRGTVVQRFILFRAKGFKGQL